MASTLLLPRYWYFLFIRILVRLIRGSAGHEAGREYEAGRWVVLGSDCAGLEENERNVE